MTKELPIPKYKIGDKVWIGMAQSTEGTHPCPDCFGSGKWAVKSPAGLETTAPCPRCCHSGYFNSEAKVPSLKYQKYVAVTRALTIGSITAKTHPWHDDDGVEYMCNETGIGSGATYREGRLYATEAEAFERAAKATSDAMRLAVAALVENVPALDEATARTVLMAIRAGLVPGCKMEIGQ